jgi:hypothetical protein
MNLKQESMSTHHRAMFATWPAGALGRGSNRLVIDDPHPPGDAWSESGRELILKFRRGSLFSRLDHPATDSILVCHFRLHEDDLIGVPRDPDRDRGDRNDRNDPEEVGVGSVLSPDPVPSETAMDAPVAPRIPPIASSPSSWPYRRPPRWNPRVWLHAISVLRHTL